MKKYITTLFFLSVLSASSIVNAKSVFPAPLIDADWLVNNSDDLVILDVRKKTDSYKDGHIEGSILVDVGSIRVDREIDGKILTRMRPDAKTFQNFMRSLGINNNSQIVLTHRGETAGQVAGAARLYWHMKFYGVENVALLDGGNAAWVAALEDLATDMTEVVGVGNYIVGNERPEILATMSQVKASLSDSTTTLLDTRGLRYHIGIDKKDYVYEYGHITGAKVLPYKFFHPQKGVAVYYPPEKLKRIVENLGINMKNSLVMFCNSAYECASDWFVLHEILGKTDVRIYDGSLHQWTQYKNNPMSRKLTQ